MNLAKWMLSRCSKAVPSRPGAISGLVMGLTLGVAAQAEVGMLEYEADELPISLFYPTTAEATAHEFGPYVLRVAKEAPIPTGQHQLVVISHGTGGSAHAHHQLIERLVAGGFVVAVPLHQGDNINDREKAGPESWRQRPQEVSAVIDFLDTSPEWTDVLDLEKVGVHGMSAGGVTGLALAGAQWRVLEISRHCSRHGSEDEGFCYMGAHDGIARIGRKLIYMLGNLLPEALQPKAVTGWQGGRAAAQSGDPRPDPRVAAVTLSVPAVVPFGVDSLASIEIPVGVVSAARDRVLKPQFHSDYLLEHCQRCTSLAALDKAGHFDVLWPWPEEIAERIVERLPVGGEVHEDFDAADRDAKQERIVNFMLEQL